MDERIAVVGEKLDPSILNLLHWSRFMVYRHSSEILHGTLFGLAYFYGETKPTPPKSLEEARINIGKQHILLLLATNVALMSIVDAFHKKYNFEYASNKSRELSNDIKNILIATLQYKYY